MRDSLFGGGEEAHLVVGDSDWCGGRGENDGIFEDTITVDKSTTLLFVITTTVQDEATTSGGGGGVDLVELGHLVVVVIRVGSVEAEEGFSRGWGELGDEGEGVVGRVEVVGGVFLWRNGRRSHGRLEVDGREEGEHGVYIYVVLDRGSEQLGNSKRSRHPFKITTTKTDQNENPVNK